MGQVYQPAPDAPAAIAHQQQYQQNPIGTPFAEHAQYPTPTQQAAPAMGYPLPGHTEYYASSSTGAPSSKVQIYDAKNNRPVVYKIEEGTIYVPNVRRPLRMHCPYDNMEVVTKVNQQPGCLACCCSGLICCSGCWPLFFLPCCFNSCLDKVHTCPHCRRTLAVVPA